MVTINHQESMMATKRKIDNVAHQHAFVLIGKGLQDNSTNSLDHAFGVHMTQYHCELHKYQVIIKFQFDFGGSTLQGTSLDNKKQESGANIPVDSYAKLRKEYPSETFFLCNANDKDDAKVFPHLTKEFSIPDLGSQTVTEFHGHIFFGIRPPNEADEENAHFFPWSADRCKAMLKNVKVKCERTVLFRPFNHLQTLPAFALYYLFGEGDEAFMTHLQTAQVSQSVFEPKYYGPDYDDVIALKEAPKTGVAGHKPSTEKEPVLGDALLKAGVVVSVPALPLVQMEPADMSCYPAPDLWNAREPVTVMYRGIGPEFSVTPQTVYTSVSAICNSPNRDPYSPERTIWTLMPERYLVNEEKV